MTKICKQTTLVNLLRFKLQLTFPSCIRSTPEEWWLEEDLPCKLRIQLQVLRLCFQREILLHRLPIDHTRFGRWTTSAAAAGCPRPTGAATTTGVGPVPTDPEAAGTENRPSSSRILQMNGANSASWLRPRRALSRYDPHSKTLLTLRANHHFSGDAFCSTTWSTSYYLRLKMVISCPRIQRVKHFWKI